jgi:hypothetical protein
MSRHRAATPSALGAAASRVDLPDDAPTKERKILCLNDFSDELVAGNAVKPHVPSREFKVGSADTCEPHSNDGFADGNHRIGIIAAKRELAVEF